MRYGLIIFGITAFLVMNIYHDNKYINMMKGWKKYYQMGIVGFLGLSLYLFFRKHPSQGRDMMKHAANIVKYIPVDKDSSAFINPLMDLTGGMMLSQELLPGSNANMVNNLTGNIGQISPQQRRILNSGGVGGIGGGIGGCGGGGIGGGPTKTKRSVSETKKKFVAAQQGWKCGHCKNPLSAWFEVDHQIRLEHGGSNHIDNLVALCRECHGKKTALEKF